MRSSITEEQRSEAKRRYEGGEPLKAIARSMEIHRTTLVRLKERECWVVSLDVSGVTRPCVRDIQRDTDAAIRSNVISFTTKKAVEQMEQSGVAAEQADMIAESLAMHGQISATMLRNAYGMMLKFEHGQIQPGIHQSECDVFNALITGVTKAVAASRDIGGLKPGDISSIQKQVQDKAIEIKIQPYAPQPLILDADGRATDAA